MKTRVLLKWNKDANATQIKMPNKKLKNFQKCVPTPTFLPGLLLVKGLKQACPSPFSIHVFVVKLLSYDVTLFWVVR